VTETPVRENISLRDENVEVTRRPVDRAVTGAENAFVDRTIEAEEHREEAVVSKDARVVEEISLRKIAQQREETISDSVRKTEVEVEDERSVGLGNTGTGGLRRD
jgi:stress response protein YsnF